MIHPSTDICYFRRYSPMTHMLMGAPWLPSLGQNAPFLPRTRGYHIASMTCSTHPRILSWVVDYFVGDGSSNSKPVLLSNILFGSEPMSSIKMTSNICQTFTPRRAHPTEAFPALPAARCICNLGMPLSSGNMVPNPVISWGMS